MTQTIRQCLSNLPLVRHSCNWYIYNYQYEETKNNWWQRKKRQYQRKVLRSEDERRISKTEDERRVPMADDERRVPMEEDERRISKSGDKRMTEYPSHDSYSKLTVMTPPPSGYTVLLCKVPQHTLVLLKIHVTNISE
jgi:hypothetical protein